VIVCGRFEGVDQRVIEGRNLEEVSIGDYVLSGGEVAAQVLLDAVIRLLPGVMGNETSGEHGEFREAGCWSIRTIRGRRSSKVARFQPFSLQAITRRSRSGARRSRSS
jgi:hypothetical protein